MDACLSIMGIINSTLPTTADFEQLALKFKSWFNVSSSWISAQLAGYILINTAELEFIFPDPKFAEIAISAWAQLNDVRFTELYNTTTAEFYNSFEPLENYNMEETTTQEDTNTGNDTHTHSGGTTTEDSITTNDTGTVSDSGNASRDGTTTHKVSAFNSSTLADAHSDTDNFSTTSTNTRTDNLTHTTTEEHTFKDTQKLDISRSDILNRTVTLSRHGNIGVTTSQQMAQSQRDLVMFDFNKYVCDEFKNEFCILLY